MEARGRCGWRGSCMLEAASDDARRGESIAESVEDNTESTEAGAMPQHTGNTTQECCNCSDMQVGAQALGQATVNAKQTTDRRTERRTTGTTKESQDAARV